MRLEHCIAAPAQLIVGCWPGRSFTWNAFPAQFCASLEAAGCTVVDVADPRRIETRLDVLHIHWPEQLFWGGIGPVRSAWRIVSTLRAIRRLRARGTAIVWMVHNLAPHERGLWQAILWRLLSFGTATVANGYMTLSPATLETVRAAFPRLRGKPATAAWHPRYPRLPTAGRTEIRQALGVGEEDRLSVFLGQVRRYKGAEQVVRRFRANALSNGRLLVAGQCDDPGLRQELEQLAGNDTRITLSFERLDEAAFAARMVAADVVVLPFRQTLHSGSIVHALSYARRVVTPAGTFADGLATIVGRKWLQTYEGEIPALTFNSASPLPETPDLCLLDPELCGTAAADLYRQLISPVRKGSKDQRCNLGAQESAQ